MGGDNLLFHSTTSTCSRTLRHLFATLHVRWLSRIFNRNACVYQTATRWDLPPYRITIWAIDWWCNVCLVDELILGFCYSDLTLETGGFELASTITPVLQANRLTKCASHPKSINGLFQWTSFYMIGTFVMNSWQVIPSCPVQFWKLYWNKN